MLSGISRSDTETIAVTLEVVRTHNQFSEDGSSFSEGVYNYARHRH